MNYYELMVIFSSTLTEEEEKAQFGQVEEILAGQKGNTHLVDHWGKRKLAYPIKKQRQGYYEWIYFEMDPVHVSEVDRKLKMSEQVLRFMLLKMEKVQIGNLQREVTRRKEAASAPPPAPAPEAAAEPAPAQAPAPAPATEPANEAAAPAETPVEAQSEPGTES